MPAKYGVNTHTHLSLAILALSEHSLPTLHVLVKITMSPPSRTLWYLCPGISLSSELWFKLSLILLQSQS